MYSQTNFERESLYYGFWITDRNTLIHTYFFLNIIHRQYPISKINICRLYKHLVRPGNRIRDLMNSMSLFLKFFPDLFRCGFQDSLSFPGTSRMS